MSRASLKAKSPRRRRKKRSTFRRRAFGGRSMPFGDPTLHATAGFDFAGVVDAVNSLFRRMHQARGR
jgi:hypothetical protein